MHIFNESGKKLILYKDGKSFKYKSSLVSPVIKLLLKIKLCKYLVKGAVVAERSRELIS
jgi:hypothetical protein